MTIRNLDALFQPRSIAHFGASNTPGSVGAVLARNLLSAGFAGPIMPVNPKYQAVSGVLAYPDVASLPITPDLAVINTPPATVPGIVADLARRGTRAAVVISAGFGESRDPEAKALQQQLLDSARPQLVRVIGPNCLGLMVPKAGINASFAHVAPKPGKLAFLAQSGAVVAAVLDWATSRDIGFSHIVSLGNMADVDFGDMLEYLARDHDTAAILLYIEAVTHPQKFLSAARAAARMKPCIVVKAGRNIEAARAAASHTGALAGADAVYDAVFRRAGMLRAFSLEHIFDAVEILALTSPPPGSRLAILTNGGGIGVLATDHLLDQGGKLATLSDVTVQQLNAVLPPTWSHGNPIDIIGDAPGSRYRAAMDILLADPDIDAMLVLNCPTAVASSSEAATAVVAAAKADPASKMIITNWVGTRAAIEARRIFQEHHLPSYETPKQATRAFMTLVNYRRNQELLLETPPSIPEAFHPNRQHASAIIESALTRKHDWLSEFEAKQLLSAYAIPVVQTYAVQSPAQAAQIAEQLPGPYVLKILSPDITHKTDVGGVILGLTSANEVRDAAENMLARVKTARPEASLDGYTVQSMVNRTGAYELIIGIADDHVFGPIVLFGQGGTAVELLADKAVGLPPLNMKLARDLIASTRIYSLLQGYRGNAAVDINGIALILVKVAQLACDFPTIAELDINPLLASSTGLIALDARIRVRPAPAQSPLVIRPYPSELENTVQNRTGEMILLRPIRPEDEPMLQDTFGHCSAEQIRMRFFMPMRTLSHTLAARFTQIDYARDMTLVATEQGIAGRTPIYGFVNMTAEPDDESAEFGILVREDKASKGLGKLLLQHLIDYARSRGIGSLYGHVLRQNVGMLKLAEALGFSHATWEHDPGVVLIKLRLNDPKT